MLRRTLSGKPEVFRGFHGMPVVQVATCRLNADFAGSTTVSVSALVAARRTVDEQLTDDWRAICTQESQSGNTQVNR